MLFDSSVVGFKSLQGVNFYLQYILRLFFLDTFDSGAGRVRSLSKRNLSG